MTLLPFAHLSCLGDPSLLFRLKRGNWENRFVMLVVKAARLAREESQLNAIGRRETGYSQRGGAVPAPDGN
jgi:hypothetical protein